MGNTDTKLNFRKAVIQLTTKTQPVETNDDSFWDQFWSDSVSTVQDFFTLIPAAEIRALREESPSTLATLCYKAVEKIVRAAEHSCRTQEEQRIALNCVRLLTRILPYIFEDPDWRGFFWSSVPKQSHRNSPEDAEEEKTQPLAYVLLNTLADLLFVPEFTVGATKKGPDQAEDLSSVDSCEYIWESGVGCAISPPHVPQHDLHRAEILKLLLTCCSELIYLPALETPEANPWVTYLTSTDNRHALPMFTSLLNVIFAYDPVGYGVPYNYLMFTDSREPLVEIAAQFLCVCVDQDVTLEGPEEISSNLFVNYLSRVHRDEDLAFLLKGFSRLLNNPLIQTYLPASCKRIQFYQELLVLFWKFCDYNKKFLYFVLKSSDVLDVLVPILYYLNDARTDQSRLGLVHIGVFILLLLSGERNFGVRLNKPFIQRIPVDVPVFTGTHADLLILVFHKMITTGHPKLQPLFDCLLTIIVNVSPYLKSLSMVAANKLLHLLEAFSTPWFLYSNPNHHHLVFFLLEVFNNLIQYQFDGNINLVYACIRKRAVFHQLANLSADHETIHKALEKKGLRKQSAAAVATAATVSPSETETLAPGKDAEPGTLKATLAATPSIKRMTEETTPLPTAPGAVAAGAWSEIEQAGNEETLDFSAIAEKMKPPMRRAPSSNDSVSVSMSATWVPTPEWVVSWKKKLPLQTIMRLLQVLVPQVEKICIDRGLTDETEIIKFLQHGTLVGLLPVPHPILIRKYQPNSGTTTWFRTYLWGVIYLRNMDPPIWYDTDVKMFEIQRV